ncbi:MAG: hypothetical protein LLF97_06880 [Planctomycetaceae bacterium]|nr:hypothetical protein [Planctomycetaceae bacterium]
MSKSCWLGAGFLSLTILAGCQHTAKPDWFHPGSEQVQQNRAMRYDPYPPPELGSITTGLRPREYTTPPAEPSRARWELGQWDKQAQPQQQQ